ncbi:hypothetical protein WJX73_004834 [Symbiochloris irregularis]|uniref:Uncharacterized protein n=1 Tax=Symbiochloris irregularis TaxID=706552 RepID=A0AAW1NRE9_9CHLO
MTGDSNGSTRQHDPFVVEVNLMLARSKLPKYLRNLYQDVLAAKTLPGERLQGERLLHHILESQTAAHRLIITRAAQTARLRSDLQSFTKGTMAVANHNAKFPIQDVLSFHRAQLENLQLSLAQQACVAGKGVALFEQLRELRAQRNSLAQPFAEALKASGRAISALGASGLGQLTRFSSLLDAVSSIKDAEMQALSTTLHQLFGDDWLSDVQFCRFLSRSPKNSSPSPEQQFAPSQSTLSDLLNELWAADDSSASPAGIAGETPVLQSVRSS